MSKPWTDIDANHPPKGTVMVKSKSGEVAYGMHVFKKHFLDEGKWMLMDKNTEYFTPVQYRDLDEKEQKDFTKRYVR